MLQLVKTYFLLKEDGEQMQILNYLISCKLVIIFFVILIFASCSDTPPLKQAHVLVIPQDNIVLAQYTMAIPQEAFGFETGYQRLRNENWTPQSQEFEFDGLTVKRKDGKSFSIFTLVLERDKRFYDRKYVSVEKVGNDGWKVLFIPLRLENIPTYVQLLPRSADVLRVGKNNITEKDHSFLIDGHAQRIAYIGPKKYIKTFQNIDLIAGEDIPLSLKNLILQQMGESIGRLTETLNIAPQNQVLMYISSVQSDRGRHSKGSVLDDGVVTFHYRGYDLNAIDERISDQIINTVAHETAHLWLGDLYKNSRNEEESWVHEGGAEYLADWSRLTQSEIRTEAQDRLNQCIIKIGTKALDGSDGSLHGQIPYNCGYFINYIADLAVLKKSDKTIADIWKSVFEGASEFEYAPKDFVNAATDYIGEDFTPFINMLLAPREVSDWNSLENWLKPLGVNVKKTKPNQNQGRWINGLWLMPLLSSYCEGSYGYYTNDTDYELDTKTGCKGSLAGGARIAKIGDVNLIENPYRAYLYAKEVCARKGELVFHGPDGTSLAPVTCQGDVNTMAPQFVIVD